MQQTATEIVGELQKAGYAAFWVGGSVRDFLLGRDPGDYDIATSATPDAIERIFERTIPVGRKFGVVVVVRDGKQFQVATFRAEADYRDGRHPGSVTFADARADALRRDFTVNGLFYDPVSRQLHDWVGGEGDLRARVIRTIGNPEERFAEDHLRLLRAVRLAAQLDFEIESGTFEAVKRHAPKILAISAERVRDELVKLFQPPHAARGLRLLHESRLLGQVLPELEATVACEQSPDHHPEGTVFEHLVLMLSQLPADCDPSLPWAVLFHDAAKPLTASQEFPGGPIHFYGHEKLGADMARVILERLRLPRRQIDDIVKAVRCHMQFKDALQMRKSTLRRLLMRPTFPLELELHRLDCLGSHGKLDVYRYLVDQIRELEQKPEIVPPLLNGDDLQALGIGPGPELGRLLSELRDRQLQEELKTPEAARAWVLQQLRTPGPQT